MSNNKEKLQQGQVVLKDILDLQMRLNVISDQKASFIMGISGIILTIIVAEILPDLDKFNFFAQIGIASIFLGCFIPLIYSIKIINPKMGERKRKDLFYYNSFLKNCKTGEVYVKDIKKLLNNEDDIIELYAMQIYDLSELVLKPKFNHLKKATNILLLGLILGSIFVVISLLHKYV